MPQKRRRGSEPKSSDSTYLEQMLEFIACQTAAVERLAALVLKARPAAVGMRSHADDVPRRGRARRRG